jgi:hypothetical protein
MKIDFEFDPEELAAIVNHRGKDSAGEADIRSFVREAISKAVGDAIVEYRESRMTHPRT